MLLFLPAPFGVSAWYSIHQTQTMKKQLLVMLAIAGAAYGTYGQTVTDSSARLSPVDASQLSDKTIRGLQKKYSGMEGAVDRQSMKLLTGMEKQEADVQKQLLTKDSVAARKMLSNAQAGYEALKARLSAPIDKTIANPLKEYIPGLDSMQTVLRYLSQGNLPAGKLQQIQALSGQLQQLQGRLQQANEVQNFASQQEQQMKDQLSRYGLGNQLLSMKTKIYYYQQQLTQYKSMLNDKNKMEQTALSMVSQLPAFKSFMQKNSLLAQLFPTADNFGTTKTIAGLQTSAQVGSMVAQRVGSFQGASQAGGPGSPSPAGAGQGGADAGQFLEQQVQAAQSDIDKLKDKLRQLGSGSGNTNMTMPDFTPNNQKTKTFLQRLEYGMNIQNTPGTYPLPVTSQIALTVGYKLSDKATAGVGASYNMGWGSGLNHIQFTSQGVGLRSYVDIKAKGSIWITGGYEYNYMQQFSGLADIRNFDLWQKSALLGLMKKYNLGKKGGNIQLLYDLLAAQEVPRVSPLKFRIGYSF
jgi:hypothetical protein